MTNRIGEALWRRRVKSWKQSGETAAQYSVRQGIDSRQLYWWSWWLRKKDASGESAAVREEAQPVGFLPVGLPRLPIPAAERVLGAEVMLGGGVVLRIVEGSDPKWAAQLVARVVAESSAC
jgi:hypothetical protein